MMLFLLLVSRKPWEDAKPGGNSFRQENPRRIGLWPQKIISEKYRIMQIRKHCKVRTPHIYYSVLHLSHILTAEDNTKKITLQMLMDEIQTLKMKCDIFQNVVDDLKSRCNAYEMLTDRNRQKVLKLHGHRGTIDTEYNEERFDLASW